MPDHLQVNVDNYKSLSSRAPSSAILSTPISGEPALCHTVTYGSHTLTNPLIPHLQPPVAVLPDIGALAQATVCVWLGGSPCR